MKNVLFIENQEVTLLSNVDDGTNRLFINGTEIPYSYWVGTGTYTYDSIVIDKTKSTTLDGNLALKEVSEGEYAFTNSVPFKALTFDDIYPVGSIYISVNNVNPSTLFGGTWAQIKDKFLLAAGSTYSNGDTGGEATHTLTVNEMPNHTHNVNIGAALAAESGGFGLNNGFPVAKDNISRDTNSKGGGQPHNNMPPYLVVAIWKRTA